MAGYFGKDWRINKLVKFHNLIGRIVNVAKFSDNQLELAIHCGNVYFFNVNEQEVEYITEEIEICTEC